MKKLEDSLKIFSVFTEKEEINFNEFIKIIENNEDNPDYDIYSDNIEYIKGIIDFDLFNNTLKKNIYIDCIKQALNNIRYKWASVSVDNILRISYYDKNKFSESQFKELEYTNNRVKNKLVIDNNLDNTRIFRDEKIKSNPMESYHHVSDARAERTVISGMDTWSSKQNGLTYGKLYLN